MPPPREIRDTHVPRISRVCRVCGEPIRHGLVHTRCRISTGGIGRPESSTSGGTWADWWADLAHLTRVEKSLRAAMISRVKHWNNSMGMLARIKMFPDIEKDTGNDDITGQDDFEN
jgi:hypothetical protein